MARAGLKYLAQPGSAAETPPADTAPTARAGLKYLPKKKSGTESFLRGAAQEASFGFADELAGAWDAITSDKTYKQGRDESRAAYKQAEEDNPGLYTAGQVTGGLASLAVPVGLGARAAGTGAKAALAAGAAYGAGASDADLTEGDVGGLAKDAAIGAGVGLAAHGAVRAAGKAVKAAAPKARDALERYARSETGDVLGGVAKSTLGKAALGAAGGAYSGDEDAVGNAVKGAALAVAAPAAHKLATKAVKKAILAALERGGPKEAAKVAREMAAEYTPPARKGAAAAKETVADVVEPDAVGTSAPTRALAGEAEDAALPAPAVRRSLQGEERLALPPMPEPTGRSIPLGPGPEGDAATAAIPLPKWPRRTKEPVPPRAARKVSDKEPATAPERGIPKGASFDVVTKDTGRIEASVTRDGQEIGTIALRRWPDGTARIMDVEVAPEMRRKGIATAMYERMGKVAQEEWGVPLRSGSLNENSRPFWERLEKAGRATRDPEDFRGFPSYVLESEGDALAAPALGSPGAKAAIAEFKEAVAKAKRLEDSGDKLRAKTWMSAAERKFKADMKKLTPPAAEQTTAPQVPAAVKKSPMSAERRRQLDEEFERQMFGGSKPTVTAPSIDADKIRREVDSAGLAGAYRAAMSRGYDPAEIADLVGSWGGDPTRGKALRFRGAAAADPEHELQQVLSARPYVDPEEMRQELARGRSDPRWARGLKAVSEVSQAMHPEPEITLYRGIGADQASKLSGDQISSGALAGFTDDPEVARNFARLQTMDGPNKGKRGKVIVVRMPRESIVISHRAFGDRGKRSGNLLPEVDLSSADRRKGLVPGLFDDEKEIVVKTPGHVKVLKTLDPDDPLPQGLHATPSAQGGR